MGFYPFRIVRRDTSASTILSAYLAVIQRSAEVFGGSLSVGSLREPVDTTASALFEGTLCGVPISGQASALLESDRGLIKFSWLPTSHNDSLAQVITESLQSCRLTRDAEYLAVQDADLEIAIPEDWTITETDQGISAHRTDNLTVSAELIAHPQVEPLSDGLANWLQLQRDRGVEYSDTKTVSTHSLEALDDAGRQWKLAFTEFQFIRSSVPMQGLISAGTTEVLADRALFLYREAPRALWQRAQSNLLAVERSASIPSRSRLIPELEVPLSMPINLLPASDAPLLTPAYLEALAANTSLWESLFLRYEPLSSSATQQRLLAPLLLKHWATGVFHRKHRDGTIEQIQGVVE